MDKITLTGEMLSKALAEAGLYLPNDVELTHADVLEIHALYNRTVASVKMGHLTPEGRRGFRILVTQFEIMLEDLVRQYREARGDCVVTFPEEEVDVTKNISTSPPSATFTKAGMQEAVAETQKLLRIRIASLLFASGGLTFKGLCEKFAGFSEMEMRRALKALGDNGIVVCMMDGDVPHYYHSDEAEKDAC